jgi:predicted nucleic acid-binding protein
VAFVVIYDACVLYPAQLRDLLVRIANTGIVRACWSEEILDECFRNIKENRADLSDAALSRTRALMREAVPDCLVTGHEHLVQGLDLPDPDDRHVLAAAIRANAQALVTFNLKDFPDHVLARYDIETKHPDEFVLDSIDIAPGAVVKCITDQAATLRNPPMLVPELLDSLRRTGLVQSVARLRDLLGPAATEDLRL